jgi:hypothetical protein
MTFIYDTVVLDRLYEYTQGVPRRINAWCDLALVAGFAEGRHEIDGEFIDLVISAQGGSLEGVESEESSISEDLAASADTSPSAMPISHNGLEATVGELSARLTRLEGLVLEMMSQMVPILAQFLEKALPPESVKPLPEYSMPDTPLPDKKLDLDPLPQTRKSWWSRFWNVGPQ